MRSGNQNIPIPKAFRYCLLITFCALFGVGHAQLRLPGVYSDHMVIQQNATVPIWGWSNPTQDVVIKVSWDTVTIRTKSANTAFWKTSVKTPVAGGPHTITVMAGDEKQVIQDVLSGEVWLCSGQSNMEWSMAASNDGKTIMEQVNDPQIRLFDVPNSAADSRQTRGEGTWKICDRNSVTGFSAVGYFFGKKLNENLHLPVGLINASWGGTPAESWVPAEIIDGNEALKKAAMKQKDDRPWCPSRPAVTFNSMINPLLPYTLAGALWYQGETNTAAPATYKQLMETLIGVWRKEFATDFPFYYVQIAPYKGYGDVEKGTLIREQQVQMQSIPKTGMVVISDLVEDVTDIHPKFKKPVGERLANVALVKTYGKSGIVYQSPQYASMKVEKQKVRLTFEFATDGLLAKNGSPTEFLIAGADHKFYPATAKIDGNTVIVSSKEVKEPVAVRYAWSNASIGNLFGKSGLPVSSFRTDDWSIPVN
ncbi:sialate O-acetylesterase [Chryseolinea sp. T2]|uniref:sialate O-acetylesterase n=1 Tax=Chryseolinea sp. T2 TaxID=3129255 RepID=UPI00307858D3